MCRGLAQYSALIKEGNFLIKLKKNLLVFFLRFSGCENVCLLLSGILSGLQTFFFPFSFFVLLLFLLLEHLFAWLLTLEFILYLESEYCVVM